MLGFAILRQSRYISLTNIFVPDNCFCVHNIMLTVRRLDVRILYMYIEDLSPPIKDVTVLPQLLGSSASRITRKVIDEFS